MRTIAVGLLLVNLVGIQVAQADQLDERVTRAQAIQAAEENNKLCQLGAPECQVPRAGMASAALPGTAAAIPVVPSTQGPGPTAALAPSEQPAPTQTKGKHRPQVVGVSVIGAEKRAEATYEGNRYALQEGDVVGGWRLVSITDKDAAWAHESRQPSQHALAGSAPSKKKSKSPALEYDVFGPSAVMAPVVIR